MADTMIERAARALASEFSRQVKERGDYIDDMANLEHVTVDATLNLNEAVTAVLKSLREPTHNVVESYNESVFEIRNYDIAACLCRTSFGVMIDKILSETP